MKDKIYYAIGDVHGEYDKLLQLHDLIYKMHSQEFSKHAMHLVHLGDYVDRGPKSCEVVEHLMALKRGSNFSITCLKGNHEIMMLEALASGNVLDDKNRAATFWLQHGGDATLRSYHKNKLKRPPKKHLKWMRGLRSYHWDKAARLIFVHAGINPYKFPNDGVDAHLWTRTERFFNSEAWPDTLPRGTKVIHGHTPTFSNKADVTKNYKRVNIDTGACYGGPLTAAILAPDAPPRFLSV